MCACVLGCPRHLLAGLESCLSWRWRSLLRRARGRCLRLCSFPHSKHTSPLQSSLQGKRPKVEGSKDDIFGENAGKARKKVRDDWIEWAQAVAPALGGGGVSAVWDDRGRRSGGSGGGGCLWCNLERIGTPRPHLWRLRPAGRRLAIFKTNSNEFKTNSNQIQIQTEEGYAIYTEDELRLGAKGGDTDLCPFDCQCCF